MLSPMLLTVAVFSLNLLTQVKNPASTITDELLAILAAVCLFGAAVSADELLDLHEIKSSDRWKFLGVAYPAFCLAIGILTFAVPVIYLEESTHLPVPIWRYGVFGFAGVFALVKPMIYEEKGWTVAYMIFAAGSIIVTMVPFRDGF